MRCLLRGPCKREPESRKIATTRIKAKYPKLINKPIPFFRRLEKELLSEKKTMKEFLSTSERYKKASYEVAYLIAKDKNHT